MTLAQNRSPNLCKNGHDKKIYYYFDKNGKGRCRQCREESRHRQAKKKRSYGPYDYNY